LYQKTLKIACKLSKKEFMSVAESMEFKTKNYKITSLNDLVLDPNILGEQKQTLAQTIG
jgi:hypothetical protein